MDPETLKEKKEAFENAFSSIAETYSSFLQELESRFSLFDGCPLRFHIDKDHSFGEFSISVTFNEFLIGIHIFSIRCLDVKSLESLIDFVGYMDYLDPDRY